MPLPSIPADDAMARARAGAAAPRVRAAGRAEIAARSRLAGHRVREPEAHQHGDTRLAIEHDRDLLAALRRGRAKAAGDVKESAVLLNDLGASFVAGLIGAGRDLAAFGQAHRHRGEAVGFLALSVVAGEPDRTRP